MTKLEYQIRKLELTFKQKQLQIEQYQLELDVLETNLRTAQTEGDIELIKAEIAIRHAYINRVKIEQEILKKQIADLHVKELEQSADDTESPPPKVE